MQLERPTPPQRSEKGKEKAVDVDEEPEEQLAVAGGGEVVHVQWGRILWITTRDQILSPLLQGALWCVSLARPLAP